MRVKGSRLLNVLELCILDLFVDLNWNSNFGLIFSNWNIDSSQTSIDLSQLLTHLILYILLEFHALFDKTNIRVVFECLLILRDCRLKLIGPHPFQFGQEKWLIDSLHYLMHLFCDSLEFIVLYFEILIIKLQSTPLALQILNQRTILPQHILCVQSDFLRSHQVFLHLTLSLFRVEQFILNARYFKDPLEWI